MGSYHAYQLLFMCATVSGSILPIIASILGQVENTENKIDNSDVCSSTNKYRDSPGRLMYTNYHFRVLAISRRCLIASCRSSIPKTLS